MLKVASIDAAKIQGERSEGRVPNPRREASGFVRLSRRKHFGSSTRLSGLGD
jgi:hypothetical protein